MKACCCNESLSGSFNTIALCKFIRVGRHDPNTIGVTASSALHSTQDEESQAERTEELVDNDDDFFYMTIGWSIAAKLTHVVSWKVTSSNLGSIMKLASPGDRSSAAATCPANEPRGNPSHSSHTVDCDMNTPYLMKFTGHGCMLCVVLQDNACNVVGVTLHWHSASHGLQCHCYAHMLAFMQMAI